MEGASLSHETLSGGSSGDYFHATVRTGRKLIRGTVIEGNYTRSRRHKGSPASRKKVCGSQGRNWRRFAQCKKSA